MAKHQEGGVRYFFNGTYNDFSKIGLLDHRINIHKVPGYFRIFSKSPFYPLFCKQLTLWPGHFSKFRKKEAHPLLNMMMRFDDHVDHF